MDVFSPIKPIIYEKLNSNWWCYRQDVQGLCSCGLQRNMCSKLNLCARQTHTVTYTRSWSELKRMNVWKCDYLKFNRSVMATAVPSSSASSAPPHLLQCLDHSGFWVFTDFPSYFRPCYTSPVHTSSTSVSQLTIQPMKTSPFCIIKMNLIWQIWSCILRIFPT